MNADITGRIQHTLYQVGAGPADLQKHCGECIKFGFAAAMVPARLVGAAVAELAGSGIPVATAVDFPFGLMTDRGRVAEARAAVEAGASEIDIGAPIGFLCAGADTLFADSVACLVRAVDGIAVKVTLELPLLTEDEAARAIRLSIEAGARWLKNASGGAVGGATTEHIRFLRAHAPPDVGVKASGAIRTARQVRELLAAGADLVGTSSSVGIVTGQRAEEDGY